MYNSKEFFFQERQNPNLWISGRLVILIQNLYSHVQEAFRYGFWTG